MTKTQAPKNYQIKLKRKMKQKSMKRMKTWKKKALMEKEKI